MNFQDITVGTKLYRVETTPFGIIHNEYKVTRVYDAPKDFTFHIKSTIADDGEIAISEHHYQFKFFGLTKQDAINLFIDDKQKEIDRLKKLISLAS